MQPDVGPGARDTETFRLFLRERDVAMLAQHVSGTASPIARGDPLPFAWIVAICLALLAPAALAQPCQPEWSDQFPASTINGIVHTLCVFDEDGDGPQPPALFVGGAFTTAGGITVNRIARWDGQVWSPLGEGMSSTVFALEVYDSDGDGPAPAALYAAGNFTIAGQAGASRIAKWNGTHWSPVAGGLNGVAYALTVLDPDDDGPENPELYVGGIFTRADDVNTNRVARWDGTAWSAVGLGMNNYVNTLAVFDADADGPEPPRLYAGGGFSMADEIPANRVAMWNGTTWEALIAGPNENGVNGIVYDMIPHDVDGPGGDPPGLYLAGYFTMAGFTPANRVVRWSDNDWTPLGDGADAAVWSIASIDHDGPDGNPASLYIGGPFVTAGEEVVAYIARWDGAAWHALDGGVNDGVRAIAAYDDGIAANEPLPLYAGGAFTIAGGHPSGHIARWGCPLDAAPPVISIHPETQSACEGDTVIFEVFAWGTPPLTYQWRKDGVDIEGETNAQLILDPMGPDDIGSYDVIVSNDFGSATSDSADLELLEPPTILEHPQPATVCLGGDISFSVSAVGSEPLEYQWRRDGSIIFGATNPTYHIPFVEIDDGGNYDCRVTSPCGTEFSETALLQVDTGPYIVEQPADHDVCVGAAVTFSVDVTGLGPIEYQWRRNGQDIPGANASTYAIDNVTVEHAGMYDVVLTNPCGANTSALAQLAVYAEPVIDEPPADAEACLGDPVTFTVAATGLPPLAYQWNKDGEPLEGATGPTLTIDTATPENQAAYDVLVISDCGNTLSPAATLTVFADTEILTQPMSHDACQGASATFSVTASGPEPLTYQWHKDGEAIEGATSSTHTIDLVTVEDAGTYDVLVTSPCGDILSDPATLTVLDENVIIDQPDSQDLCVGQPLQLSVAIEGPAPLGYQWRLDGEPIAGATDAIYEVPSVTLLDAGSYDVLIDGVCGTLTSTPATVGVFAEPEITTQPQDIAGCEGNAVSLTVTATGFEPLTYQWRKDNTDIPGATSATLNLDSLTLTDAGIYDVLVTSPCGANLSDPALVSVGTTPQITTDPVSHEVCQTAAVTFTVVATGTGDLQYQWRYDGTPIDGATQPEFTIDPVAPADGGTYDVLVSNNCGEITSAPAQLDVIALATILTQPQSQAACAGDETVFTIDVDAPQPVTYTWRKDGTPIDGAINATYIIDSVAPADAGTYDVVITTDCGDVLSNPAELTVDEGSVIDTQPQSQSACIGAAAAFTVTATGPEPLTYQWRHEGLPILGANTPTLVLPAVTTGDAGTYDVTIDSRCGATVSEPATLTVNTGAVVLTPPADQQACAGATVTLTVDADGTPPLQYQWQHEGTPLTGATSATLTINNITPADAGAYDVIVTSPCGQTLSEPATVTVLPAPAILRDPQSQGACAGDRVELYVVVAADQQATFAWRRDGQPLTGQTAANLILDPVTLGDGGTYDVVVTAACGSITSAPAIIDVVDCASLPGLPSNPQPADRTDAVAIDTPLTWEPATGATSYELHLGLTQSPPYFGATTTPAWNALNLEHGTTYYWQVVAVNDVGSTPGPVWSFTSVAATSGDNPGGDDSGQDEPDTPLDDVAPPGCGAGACGAGFVGYLPFSILGWLGLKRRFRHAAFHVPRAPGV